MGGDCLVGDASVVSWNFFLRADLSRWNIFLPKFKHVILGKAIIPYKKRRDLTSIGATPLHTQQ